ncbi:takeout [Carabus blaptoides fortunei]
MIQKSIFILFVCFLVQYCEGFKLPPYFSQCSRSDPKLHECILHNANGGLSAFVKGDKMYNIQSMLPLYIPHISLPIDRDLRVNLSDSIIGDLSTAKIKDVKIDLEDKRLEIAMYMSRATLLGQYKIKGKISILPIDEKGPVNITVVHSRIKYSFDYDIIERKDKHYINITDSSMTYKSERSFFKFYNLFSENAILGDVINDSLNEHWTETNREIAPKIASALSKIATSSLQGFFEKIPYEELMRD